MLLQKNLLGQTLLTLIEVNRESLSESLPLVLKREYGCHRRDMMRYMVNENMTIVRFATNVDSVVST